MSDHVTWDERAAAYSLDALDHDERAEFEAHLATCSRCREAVDSHALVAAQLGAVAGDGVAAPPWSRIREGILGGPAKDDANVVVLHHRRRNVLLAAAAAVVVVAVGVTAWQGTRGSATTHPLASVAACQQVSSCHVVALKTKSGSPASVLVDGDHYTLVSTGMPAPPSGHVWALWQVPHAGAPTLLTEFTTAVHPAPLKAPYGNTAGFAVSEERSGSTPASPTRVVAVTDGIA